MFVDKLDEIIYKFINKFAMEMTDIVQFKDDVKVNDNDIKNEMKKIYEYHNKNDYSELNIAIKNKNNLEKIKEIILRYYVIYYILLKTYNNEKINKFMFGYKENIKNITSEEIRELVTLHVEL